MNLNNRTSVFSGDELMSSYVFNSLVDTPIMDSFGKFLKRIWTLSNNYNFKPGDLHLPIWYLPAEKEKGLRELFHELTNPDSVFWLSKAPSAVFLGKFFNIPKSKIIYE